MTRRVQFWTDFFTKVFDLLLWPLGWLWRRLRPQRRKTPNRVTRKALREAEHPENLESYDRFEDIDFR